MTGRGLHKFRGCIAAAAFASGDQIVIGAWRSSPLGQLIDVMWVRPDGERVLLAPSKAAAEYVSALYAFDRVDVVRVRGGWSGELVDVWAGPVAVQLWPERRDWRSWIFAVRPSWLRRAPVWLEMENRLVKPLGRVLLGGAAGVQLTGITPGGRREWYSVEDYRRLRSGRLTIRGRDAGRMTSLRPDLGVGLSAFPTRPAFVHLTTLIAPG